MAKLTDEEILIRNGAFAKGSRPVFAYLVRADIAHAIAPKDAELMPFIADRRGNLYVKDEQLADVISRIKLLEQTNTLIKNLTEGIRILNSIKVQTKTVACPPYPIEISGSNSSGAYTAGDCFGTQFKIKVPKSGRLNGAIFYDLDDEGLQVDLEIFSSPIIQVASESAFAPNDNEALTHITELQFFAFDDHGVYQTSEVKNFGKDYVCPSGEFHIQAVTRGAPTIAATALPRVQLFILSDDPNWEE